MSPLSVLTVRLSVKLESNTLAPPTTWYFKTTSNVGSSISDNEAKFNSVNSLLKASLIGEGCYSHHPLLNATRRGTGRAVGIKSSGCGNSGLQLHLTLLDGSVCDTHTGHRTTQFKPTAFVRTVAVF